jgi:hypothetical protein
VRGRFGKYNFTEMESVPQSIHSARLSIQSSELGSPTPSPSRECCSPALGAPPLWVLLRFGSEGGDTLACGGGATADPNSDDGTDTLVLCTL